MLREEFMRLSPRYFARLITDYQASRRRADEMVEVMMAQMIAMVANTGFRGYETVRQPQEFMPTLLRAKPKRQRIDRKNLALDARAYFARARASRLA